MPIHAVFFPLTLSYTHTRTHTHTYQLLEDLLARRYRLSTTSFRGPWLSPEEIRRWVGSVGGWDLAAGIFRYMDTDLPYPATLPSPSFVNLAALTHTLLTCVQAGRGHPRAPLHLCGALGLVPSRGG